MAEIKQATENLLKTESKEDVSDYQVYVVTWNVGSRFPDNISLRNLLDLEKNEDGSLKRKQLPDIYAIGLQEVNMEMKQQMRNIFMHDPWTKKINHLLHELDYVTIQTEQMQGLLLSVYIKRQHVQHLRSIEGDYTRTGFGGLWGNKGAISLRFNLYGCGLVFVEAHLAAHDEHLSERVEDYKQILDDHHYKVAGYTEIHDHDYIWWFGDLNFRLHGDDAAEEVRSAVLRGDTKELLKRDQLNYLRLKKKEVFELLHEELPTFPPTFKFKEGTSEYDMKRRPAWTDRILYAIQPVKRQPNKLFSIKQLKYRSHPEYSISDHKPVSGEFNIELFSKYREPCVIFTNVTTWSIGDENLVHFVKPVNFVEGKRDWIGIFPVNYRHLRDYAGYEYVQKDDSSSSSSDDEYRTQLNVHNRHEHRHGCQRVRRQREGETEEVFLMFDDDLKLVEGQLYKLIYFHCPRGHKGPSSILGMSNEFDVKNAVSISSID